MRHSLYLSIGTAVLLGLSFAPLPFGFLAYVALVPFLLLLRDLNFKESLRWGYITGFFISFFTIYWLVFPTSVGVVAAFIFHATYYAVFAIAYHRILRISEPIALISAPFIWTSLEYLKSIGELGFPWVSLGYSQSYYLPLIQYVEYTSVYGVSFWVCLLNVGFYYIIIHRNEKKSVAFAVFANLVVFILPLFFNQTGTANSHKNEAGLKLALIQGNIDPYQKWEKENRERSFFIYDSLSRSVGRNEVDLIIWPETATPAYLLRSRKKLPWVIGLSRDLNTPILTGTPDYEWIDKKNYKSFNSITLIDQRQGPFDIYSKMRLVPFGERVPYQDFFFFLKDILSKFNMGEGNFSPGDSLKLFELKPRQISDKKIKIGGVICFESIFPEFVSSMVRKGANIIVIVTNDGWYKRTGAPYQHAQMAVFRAIENRIDIARCANTGISMTIDQFGNIKKETGIFEKAVLVDELSTRKELTYFTRHGHVFSHIVSALALLILVFTYIFEKYIPNDNYKPMAPHS